MRALALFSMLFALAALGDIVPADRMVDWTLAGVQGGIPNRTTIWTNVAGIDNTGTDSVSTELNAIIAACPSNQVVFLPAGQYRLTGQLLIAKNGVTLRGSGPTQTVLVVDQNSNYPILIYGLSQEGGEYPQSIYSGAVKGATSMSLVTATNLHVGSVLRLSQDEDGVLVNTKTGAGSVMRQNIRLLSVSGTNVTFEPPLFWDYTNTPVFVVIGAAELGYYNVQLSGIEDLQITNKSMTLDQGITLAIRGGVNCWVKNVEIVRTSGYHIMLNRTLFCTVRDSYIHDAVSFGSSQGYGVIMYKWATASLVENNLLDRLIAPIMTAHSSSGNVIGYNCSMQTIQGTGELTNWMAQAFNATHGSHSMMNLWEGNVGCQYLAENYFGSGSHQTLLRNWFTTSSIKDGGGWVSIVRRAISLDAWQYYYNVVGNVLGNDVDPVDYYAMSFSTTVHPVIYRIGWANMGNDSTNGYDPNTLATLIRHGNWDTISAAVVWDGGIADHVIPNSYYLASKPSWFNSLTWPPFEPTTAVAMNPLTPTNIPAGYRFVYGTDPPAATTRSATATTARVGSVTFK